MGLARAGLFPLASSDRFERGVKHLPGEAVAWRAASRYVAGRSRADALEIVERLLACGHLVSIDLFGERVDDPVIADRVLAEYLQLAAVLPASRRGVWLSVDLSHVALATDARAAADRLATIAGALPPGRRLQVGAEEAAHTDAIPGNEDARLLLGHRHRVDPRPRSPTLRRYQRGCPWQSLSSAPERPSSLLVLSATTDCFAGADAG